MGLSRFGDLMDIKILPEVGQDLYVRHSRYICKHLILGFMEWMVSL